MSCSPAGNDLRRASLLPSIFRWFANCRPRRATSRSMRWSRRARCTGALELEQRRDAKRCALMLAHQIQSRLTHACAALRIAKQDSDGVAKLFSVPHTQCRAGFECELGGFYEVIRVRTDQDGLAQ